MRQRLLRAALAAGLLPIPPVCALPGPVPALPAPILKTNDGGVYTEDRHALDLLHRHYTLPPDRPAAPGDVFRPPVTPIGVEAAAPSIGEFTRQAGADRGVILQGDDFTAGSGAASGSDTRVWVYTQTSATDGRLYEPRLLRETDQTVIVALDTNLPYGLALLWVENRSGAGFPVRLNAADAWWVGPDHVQPGQTANVYGRNLSRSNATAASYVYLRPWSASSNAPSTSCAVHSVNPYKVGFTVPAELPPDAFYEVWLHNGHGGDYGWSGPLKLSVESTARHSWAGNVRSVTDYGALPDDGLDDTAALQDALDAAGDGDVIVLPAGTFLITNRLVCGAGVSVEGAGTNLTTLATGDPAFNAPSMLRITGFPGRVRDLTFSSVATQNMSHGMLELEGYAQDPVPQGVRVDHCRFDCPVDVSYHGLDTGWCDDIRIAHCAFTGGRAIWVYKARQVFIQDNAFLGTCTTNGINAVGNGYGTWSVREMDFSGNSAGSYDRANGLSLRRLFVASSPWGNTFDVYLGANRSSECGPLPGGINQNSGENILLETGSHHLTTNPVSVAGTTLTFAGVNWEPNQYVSDDLPGWNTQSSASVVYVQRGRGMGQWRCILSNSVDTLTLDRPWDAPPDTNSLVTIVETAARYVVHGNTLDGLPDDDRNGTPDYLERDCAVAAIETYGTCLDVVIAGNRATRMRYGIFCGQFAYQIGQPDFRFEHLAHALITDNVVTDAWKGILICCNCTPSPGSGDPGLGPLALNCVVRDNRVSAVDQFALGVDRTSIHYHWDWPWMQNTLLEHNTVCDAGTGMRFGKHQGNTLLRANRFARAAFAAGTTGVTFDECSATPRLSDNVYETTIETVYAGALPGAGLQLDRRCLVFAGAAGDGPAARTVTVRNVGTDPLSVTVSTNGGSWLAASPAWVAAPDERTAALVTVTADLGRLSGGIHEGWITLSGGALYSPLTLGVLAVVAPRPPASVFLCR